jgi:DNA-binding transcriptional regulator YiaG
MSNIHDLVAEIEATRSVPSLARCRAIRRDANVSLARLAAVLQVTPGTVCNWEAGRRRPRGANAVAYAEALRALEHVGPEADGDL